jgi:16S rRNA (guanine1207-N2)-methyltransferase
MKGKSMIHTVIKDIELSFNTSQKIFSPLTIDKGTLAMLSCVEFAPSDKVLDLGCGYGPVGILAAKLIGEDKIVMVDNQPEAVKLASENAVLNGVSGVKVYMSDGVKDIDEKDFTIILSNPPYHEDFNVAKAFIEKGFNRLALNGRMIMVTKRDVWYRNKLTAIFGGARVSVIDGYFVFIAEKRSLTYANKKPDNKKK